MFQHFLAPTLLWTQRESLLMILTRFENKRLTPKVTFSFFGGGKVPEGDVGKTMAARGLVNGRGPLRRSGRDLVFPTSPSGPYA